MEHNPEQHGCPDECDETLLLSKDFIRRYAMRRRLANDVEDICQELWYQLEKAKRDGKDVRWNDAFGLLRNIARKKAREMAQPRAYERQLVDIMKAGSHSSQATCPEEIVAQKELIERIYEIVNGLKREQRFVFNMRFIPKSAKVTFSEIGRIIDKSPSSVRCYYRSALHAVQRQLRSAEETEPEPVTTLRGATPGDEVTSPKGEKP